MARHRTAQTIEESDLHHFAAVKRFYALLQDVVTGTKLPPTFSHPRRVHSYAPYLGLFLLGVINPVVKTMRGLCAASRLERVQRLLDGPTFSLGTFSEMQHVLDPELLHRIFADLARQSRTVTDATDLRLARLDLVAQDGTLWRALPRMGWAEYGVGSDGAAKGVRLHLRFHLVKDVPCEALITRGKFCERKALRQMLQPGQINVGDRYYGKDYQLFGQIEHAEGFFVIRVADDSVINEEESLPISAADQAAGVVRHAWVRLGAHVDQRSIRLRLVEVHHGAQRLLLVTNLPVDEVTAELVGLIYRRRWHIEIFFRWIKCILGHRHFFAESPAGVAIQLYLALIASLLLQLYTGKRPNKRQFEAIQFYLMGWATEQELVQLIALAEPKKR